MTEVRSVQRVVVVGSSGSGKSTVAEILASRLALPFHPTDSVFWSADWQPTSADHQRAWLGHVAATDRWVLDGNFDAHHDLHWRRSDLLIWLDPPLMTSVTRVAVRNLGWWLTGRPAWGVAPMSLSKAWAGVRHAIQSHGIKRRLYPDLIQQAVGDRFLRIRSSHELRTLVQGSLAGLAIATIAYELPPKQSLGA